METPPRPCRYLPEPPQACGLWPVLLAGPRPRGALACARPTGHGGRHESAVGDFWPPSQARSDERAAAPPGRPLLQENGEHNPDPGLEA
ncbi:hypothetical protein [Nocardiopsis composta]|uniref:Uncharacterized protein n=1 Tax=Nocardiopsis composta TaxID=157465 RepID=A0A7W8VG80_9ACTN|nr:hypothetical protein [Nocardiopsis composta]MBB5435177.1 hypothetical protein [Nocardiopsis composta]